MWRCGLYGFYRVPFWTASIASEVCRRAVTEEEMQRVVESKLDTLHSSVPNYLCKLKVPQNSPVAPVLARKRGA